MRDRQGCLAGLFELLLLDKLFDWLQRRFGFGKGCSCTGIGCGLLLVLVFVVIAFSILTRTDWLRLF